MKILLCRIPAYFGVANEHPENTMIPVEMAYMSSIAKQLGFQVELLDLEARPIKLSKLKLKINEDYDYIVLRAKTPSFDLISKIFQNTPAAIIGIGHLFATKSEAIFSLVNFNILCAINGEAEVPFRLLLNNIINKKSILDIPNLILKNPSGRLIQNNHILLDHLDELPSPDFALFDVNLYYSFWPLPFGTKKKYGFMMTSRGCPYSCSFCSSTLRNSYGQKMRFHSYERIINDLKFLEHLGRTIVYFRDDIFTANKQFTIGLCREIIKSNVTIKWSAQTNINNIDEELLEIMHEAGCVALGFGIESGSQKILNNLCKTNRIERAPRLIQYAKKLGIKTICFFLVGCPQEDRLDHRLTIDLLKKTLPDLIQVAFFTPYPGSRDYDKYIRCKTDYDYTLHHYNNYKINYTQLTNDEVEGFQKKMYRTWLFTPQTVTSIILSIFSDLFFNFSFLKIYIRKGLSFFKGLFVCRNNQNNGYTI